MRPVEILQVPPDPPCLSDLALDRLLIGELAGEGAVQARAHIDRCGSCAGRLQSLEASAGELFRLHPTLGLGRPFAELPGPPIRAGAHWRRLSWAAGALATAAALILVVAREPFAPSGTRAKGGSSVELELFVKRGDGRVEALARGGSVAPGDALRFQVSSGAEPGFVAVLSVDGAGTVSRYAPIEGPLAPLPAHERRLLEGSIVLDGQLGRERVLAFLCAEPSSGDALLTGLRAVAASAGQSLGPIELGLDCVQSSFWFTKVGPE